MGKIIKGNSIQNNSKPVALVPPTPPMRAINFKSLLKELPLIPKPNIVASIKELVADLPAVPG